MRGRKAQRYIVGTKDDLPFWNKANHLHVFLPDTRYLPTLVITVPHAVIARDDGACVRKENYNAQPRSHDAQSWPSSPQIITYLLSAISLINMGLLSFAPSFEGGHSSSRVILNVRAG